ncbi:ribbon-helix-helix domain-containing protein [Belnapia rosea]|uniref:Antitoxin ParD1/3/4 n=1 Tax=Belnapia rosea TaxID=938405 RepID=A0A1G6KNC9_9PROT|nr:type II toxin-antitoxin system ParD family antitoxin [Belnapia rosea]SDB19653.1 antitoxin ParD1/3/4 [Belnapia rosea]SDC32331.1 antitoxin ParD1/3/4 [Belnapia rosea]
MPQAVKRNVALPPDQARYIDTLVASGAYRSKGAVIRAALRALQARDEAMERWVRVQVVPVLDALQPDRGRATPDDHLRTAVRRQQAVWLEAAPEGKEG